MPREGEVGSADVLQRWNLPIRRLPRFQMLATAPILLFAFRERGLTILDYLEQDLIRCNKLL